MQYGVKRYTHLTACNPIVLAKRTHTLQVDRLNWKLGKEPPNYHYLAMCVYQVEETGADYLF